MKLLTYEHNDEIPLMVGFYDHKEQLSYIAFRLHISVNNCPSYIDQDLIQDDLNTEVMLYVKNFSVKALTSEVISNVYDDNEDITCRS